MLEHSEYLVPLELFLKLFPNLPSCGPTEIVRALARPSVYLRLGPLGAWQGSFTDATILRILCIIQGTLKSVSLQLVPTHLSLSWSSSFGSKETPYNAALKPGHPPCCSLKYMKCVRRPYAVRPVWSVPSVFKMVQETRLREPRKP